MMPPHSAASRINRKALGREHILPDPFRRRLWIFAGQRRPDIDSGNPIGLILFINNLHPGKMFLQWNGKPLRQHRYPVLLSLSITHHDLMAAKVNVLNPETHTLHEPQAASIHQASHERSKSFHLFEKGLNFTPGHHLGQPLRALGPHKGFHLSKGPLQGMIVKEHQCIEGLVLSAGRNLPLHCEIVKIFLHRRCRINTFRVGVAMKGDETTHPIKIGCLCPDRVMAAADFCFQGINQGGEKPLNLAGNHPVAESPCNGIDNRCLLSFFSVMLDRILYHFLNYYRNLLICPMFFLKEVVYMRYLPYMVE